MFLSLTKSFKVIKFPLASFIVASSLSFSDDDSKRLISFKSSSLNLFFFFGFASSTLPPPIVTTGENNLIINLSSSLHTISSQVLTELDILSPRKYHLQEE